MTLTSLWVPATRSTSASAEGARARSPDREGRSAGSCTTPDSPVSNFLLNGKIYFDGTLTYNSAGDPGNDGDFYAGTMTLSFNSPYTGGNSVGVPTVSDNCDPQPVVTFTDVVTGTACDTIITHVEGDGFVREFSMCPQTIHVVDTVPPVFAECCPLPTINVNADAGSCSASYATVAPTTPTATDAISAVTMTYVRSDNALALLTDPYPSGSTTITWTATDACNNQSTCTQVVNVSGYNELLLTVQLQPNIAPPGNLTRCVRLELWACPGPTMLA